MKTKPTLPRRKTSYLKSAISLLFATALLSHCFLNAQPRSPADSLHASHYEIHVNNIDFQAKSISASTTVTLTPVNSPVSAISLELIALTVTAVWLDGVPVTDFTQTDSLVTIIPPSPLQTGDTAVVRIDYNGVPFHETWGGFHFSGEYAFNMGVGLSTIPHNLGKSWYPCVDNFTDRATYDVYCTLPEGKMAIGGGLLTEEIDNGNGTKTWHWELEQAVPTYLSSLAAGNYISVNDVYNGIAGQVMIHIYVRPQDTSKVEGTFVHLKDILAIFEQCMGPYRWDRVGYTSTALGSMEHATNIFLPHSFFNGNTAYESTIAHELTHMWMGDEVTCSSAQEMWINEGWATFFGMYYALALYGDEDAYKKAMRDKHGSVLQNCHTAAGDGSYFPLNVIPQEYTYGMSAYDRGATVCQALRFYLGDDLFFQTLTAFIDAFSFQPASSYDMRDFMTEFTGKDMSGFFDNYILHSGTPQYSVDSFNVVARDERSYDVNYYVKQKRHGPAFNGNGNIMEVMFMDNNWNTFTDTIHFNGKTGSAFVILPFQPTIVLADPEEKMCDATTDNYKKIKATGTFTFEKTFFSMDVANITDSAFVQVTHNWAPPDSLKTPVTGLRISDYRYWQIGGIFPEGFQSTGKFFYSVNNYLDNTLITSSSDTVIILYRKGASEDWQEVDFEKVGPWNIGNIIVTDLKAGEYTLAVKESTVGYLDPVRQDLPALDIYPNPSSESFNIIYCSNTNGEIRIYSENGTLVKSFPFMAGQDLLTWSPGPLAAGNYLVALYKENATSPEIRRVLYLPVL
jgi:aminopeptidase N